MGYKNFLGILSILCLTGCSTITPEQKQAYRQGYRTGIEEQIRTIAAQFQGGDFPYYHWTSPIVQDVNVPARISNGVFIPEHKELVIIKPGEWAQSPAYPIQSEEETYEHTTYYANMDVSDITALPNSKSGSGDDQPAGKSTDLASGMDKEK